MAPRTSTLRLAIDARSLLCAQPRGEGKSLLRLYTEVARIRPDLQLLFFGDERASRYQGELPSRAELVMLPSLTHRFEVWEDVLFPWRARWAGCHAMHCASSSAPRHALLPVLLTVHDLIPMVFDDGHDAKGRAKFRRRLGYGVRQAAAIICVSDNTRRDLLMQFPDCKAPVSVAHWGCDVQALPERHTRSEPTVLIFGGEAHRKNTMYAVDRFIAAARRVPRLRLEIVGLSSPDQRNQIAQHLERAGLADRAHMPGFVTETELAATLQRATVLLYLSLYEGFGLPVLEAIAQGLPVLASNLASLPEVLAGAPGAFALDDPEAIEDAVVRVSTSAQARLELLKKQRGILSRFGWNTTALHYLTVLDRL